MTTSTRNCHPLLEALLFGAVDGWHWPMLLLSPQTKHIKFEKETEEPSNTPITHPTRDSEGYPLEGFDEVDKQSGRNLAGTLKEPDRNLTEILQVFLKYFIYMMTTQTLEAIPEENVERVTSDVPKTKPATVKNPGHVASGKRLAERNRLAREAKKQAEAQKPAKDENANTTEQSINSNTNTTEQSNNSSKNTGYFIVGISGLIISGLGVYYQREAIKKPPAESNTVVEEPKRKGRTREME